MLLAAVASLYVSSAGAGLLATDPNAFTNGLGETFHGSSPLTANFGLKAPEGYLDWAVYEYGHRPAGYAGVEADPGQFLYAFQFHNTGAARLDLVVFLAMNTTGNYAVDQVGFFTSDGIGGKSGSYAGFADGYSEYPLYDFSDHPVLQGESTVGLSFSSNWPAYLEMVGLGIATNQVDEYSDSIALPLPGPRIPEPSSFVLAALGLVGLVVWGWWRKR